METNKVITTIRLKKVLGLIVLCGFIFPFQNCAQQDFSVTQSSVNTVLVYDHTDSDQQLLKQKLDGAEPPTISQIFSQWSRVSGTTLYQLQSDIVPSVAAARCFTGLDENGDWIRGYLRDNKPTTLYQPGTETLCATDESFSSASWSFNERTNSLKAAVNSDRVTGFVSGVQIDRYINEAIVSAEQQTDDDGIGLIIAALRDSSGVNHILMAKRTQGGLAPNLGWGFVYLTYRLMADGSIKKTTKHYSNTSVDGIYKNSNEDGVNNKILPHNGWAGKRSLIRVVREKDIVKAYTSKWDHQNSDGLVVEADSEISLDLSDSSLGLEIFRGPQKYGYGSLSQYGATFSKVKFKSTLDADKLYDLKNKLVYKLIDDDSGRYELVPGLTPKKDLGVNIYLVNPETQKTFFVWYNGVPEEVRGDIPEANRPINN